MANRPQSDIEKDCQKIKRYWAYGWEDAQIRQRMDITHRQWETRLKHIAKDEDLEEKLLTWKKYEVRKRQRYKDFDALKKKAERAVVAVKDKIGRITGYMADRTALRVVLGCIEGMSRLDNDIMEKGQTLGVFHKEADNVNVSGITVITSIPQPGQKLTPQQEAMLRKAEQEAEARGRKNGGQSDAS